MKFKVKIKKLRNDACVPEYATAGAAACDLCYAGDGVISLKPNETKLVPTGIAISMQDNTAAALIYARSGLASNHGIAPANCVGVIDSDYRGEIKVPLRNNSDTEFFISPKDRIAQLIFTPIYGAIFEECDELDKTCRGEGGFGSTGK